MKQLTHDLLPLFLMAGIVIVSLVAFWKLFDIVILSVSIAVVMYPAYLYCSRYMNRYLSAALVTALVFTIIFVTLFTAYSIISPSRNVLLDHATTIQDWVSASTSSSVFGLPIDRAQVAGWFESAERIVVNYWNSLVSDPVLIAFKIFIFFLSFYVVLLHGATIFNRILGQVPGPLKSHFNTMSSVTVDTLFAIYIVHAGISALTFFIAIPVFYFLGYGHVLFYSFVCAFCELIPVLGASAIFIFLGVYALAIGDINSLIFIIIFGYVGVSALPEIYIRPVLMGRRVKLHPLTMLVGFFGGVITMGIAGFVLGPVFIVLLLTGYRILLEERKAHDSDPSRS